MIKNFKFVFLNFELSVQHLNGDIKYMITQVCTSGRKSGTRDINLRIIGLGMVFKTMGLDEIT